MTPLEAQAAEPYAQVLIWLAYALVFGRIAIIDIKTRRIPTKLLLPGAALAIFDAAALPTRGPTLESAIAGGCVGFGLFYLVYLAGIRFARRIQRRHGQAIERAFGFGDVRLMGVAGLITGFPVVLPALALAVLLGGLMALSLIGLRLAQRGEYAGLETLPYAPAIILGTGMALLLRDQIAIGWLAV